MGPVHRPPDPGAPRRRAALCAALALLVAATFAGAARNGFVSFDDDVYLTANPRVRDGLTAASLHQLHCHKTRNTEAVGSERVQPSQHRRTPAQNVDHDIRINQQHLGTPPVFRVVAQLARESRAVGNVLSSGPQAN
jgi:hypothetical protein